MLVTVAEPVERDRHTVGIILLTRDAREVETSLFVVRVSILGLFGLALGLTVLLSWYLSLTIARPILRLAGAAAEMREGHGRAGSVPAALLQRRDEVGALATALADSAQALFARMDAIERFAADVAHEIENPLSSIRSAIETLRRIEDPVRQRQLLTIIAQDVTRLDRLISEVSDASRLDAELSRVSAEPVDIVPMMHALRELDEATRDAENDPRLVVDAPASLKVWAVEDRLVQVLRNLIANAQSFSPQRGRIALSAHEAGGMVEISVEDEGPGIPEGNLEHIFNHSIPSGRRGRSSGSIRGSVCQSAGRSSRRCMGRSPRRTAVASATRCWAPGSWCGCRKRRRPQIFQPRCEHRSEPIQFTLEPTQRAAGIAAGSSGATCWLLAACSQGNS